MRRVKIGVSIMTMVNYTPMAYRRQGKCNPVRRSVFRDEVFPDKIDSKNDHDSAQRNKESRPYIKTRRNLPRLFCLFSCSPINFAFIERNDIRNNGNRVKENFYKIAHSSTLFGRSIPGLSRRCRRSVSSPWFSRSGATGRGSGSAPGFSLRGAEGEHDAEGRVCGAPLERSC